MTLQGNTCNAYWVWSEDEVGQSSRAGEVQVDEHLTLMLYRGSRITVHIDSVLRATGLLEV